MNKRDDKVTFYKNVYDEYVILHQSGDIRPLRDLFRKAQDSYDQIYIYSLLTNNEYGVAKYIKTKDLFKLDKELLDREILDNIDLLSKVFNHYKYVPKGIDLSHGGKFGYIYILSNKGMPDLLKIGYTCSSAFERAKQLSSTSVAYPFDVVYLARVRKPEQVEKGAHDALENHRVNENREFFKVDIETAIEAIESIATYLKRQDSSQRFDI